MPPRAPKTQVLERYKVEREDGAPLFADCTAPGEPLRTIPLGSTVVMLEEHTPQRAGKGGGTSGDAEPWGALAAAPRRLRGLRAEGDAGDARRRSWRA